MPNKKMSLAKSKFEMLLDKYGPMVHQIALQISPTAEQAEEILIKSFADAYKQNIAEQSFPSPFISLIKILINRAQRQFGNSLCDEPFKLPQFEKLPVLQKILCEQTSLEIYCVNNKITREELGKQLRTELLLLRKSHEDNLR
jgi:hypothetical protein